MKPLIARGKFSKAKRKPTAGESYPPREKSAGFSKERRKPTAGESYPRREKPAGFSKEKRTSTAGESYPRREKSAGFSKEKRTSTAGESYPRREKSAGFSKEKRTPTTGESYPRREKPAGFSKEKESYPRRDKPGGFSKERRKPTAGESYPRGDKPGGFSKERRGESYPRRDKPGRFSKEGRKPRVGVGANRGVWEKKEKEKEKAPPLWMDEGAEGGGEGGEVLLEGSRRGAQWVWGLNPVKALFAHAPQKVIKLYLAQGQEGGRVEFLQTKAEAASVPVEWADRHEMDLWTGGGVHQGILAQVSAFSLLTEEALLELVLPAEGSRILLLLDGVEDPQNLGAIARTALAMGVSALVIGKNRSAGITPGAMKASAGALVYMPVAQVTNLSRLLERLKEGGYWSLAASPQASTALWGLDAKGPWAVVIGGEGRGVGANLLRHCDFQVKIPMVGQISSLNASVSTGMVLYELLRQREGLKVGAEEGVSEGNS